MQVEAMRGMHMMQTLDIARPDMPDLQFVLLVTALCTSHLPSLNVPESLRTTMFDRCWRLIHDSPPPSRPEERVLDLRPWDDVTLEAMVETIRWTLSEVGVRILMWDHQPGETTFTRTCEAQAVIGPLNQPYYPQLSAVRDVFAEQSVESALNLDHCPPDVWQLLGKTAASMAPFPSALEHRAREIAATDKDSALAAKLLEGVDVMRRITNTFLTWGRHYARLADDPRSPSDVGKPPGV